MNKDNNTNQEPMDEPLVVGLGASAGGLEPLKTFFGSLPDKTGMAFIVIVHLSPEHKSSMAELLQMQTPLEALQVNERTEIQPDHIYVIPPNKLLTVGDNHLELSEPEQNGGHRSKVVDQFFRSLGKVKGSNSVSITLSGTGSDGAVGIKAIKENGGLTIAQDPAEAKYDGMPQSAINTGCVDKILPVGEMAQELMEYKENFSDVRISDDPEDLSEDDEEVLSKIFAQVRKETDHDFSHYKRSTVLRRIERRMHVNRAGSLADYLSYLKEHAGEAQELFKDLLISVTNFFRDPEAFAALENKVISKLFEGKNADDELRVWVPGCATGEEAYSIAMLLHEYAGSIDHPPQLQVFATDLDEAALKMARQGRYPESIATDLTSERLNRFFNKDDYEYRVKDELKSMMLFAKHNLLGSPPFSKLDMVSCRNLLIYLNRELQGEVFNLFHYALQSEGWLFLGTSDSNLEATELFTSVDKQHRIYRQSSKSQSKIHLPDFPLQYGENQISASHSWKMKSNTKDNFEKLHRMLITRQYAPPSVIINEHNEVLHATGGIDDYLKYSDGEPSRNILEMVIRELRQPLRSILYQAKKEENDPPIRTQLHLDLGDELQLIELSVHKIKEVNFPDDLMYIVFRKIEDNQKPPVDKKVIKDGSVSDEEVEIIEELENELKHTKEQLQITVEDYETSNEELRASNEELQSMNEELQSTTEELETSQEELQSVNEELKTVNQELESKIEDLHRSNSDLKNLMEATEIGIVFVDREHRVKRFTSPITELINLTSSDIGRPLEHFANRLTYDGLLDDIKNVLDNSIKVKKEVSDKNNRNYIMRLRLYHTTEDKIEGVVITFVDVTELKSAEEEVKQTNIQLAKKLEKIQELQRQILKNDVNERWKIGQVLHDELAQSLSAAKLTLDRIKGELGKGETDFTEEIEGLREIIKQGVADVRDLSHEIVPIDVQQEETDEAFSGLSTRLEKIYGIDCTVEGNSIVDGVGDIEVATHLYRIVREAAQNAAVHGEAKNVRIVLRVDDNHLYLHIEDDGRGFAATEGKGEGMGIHIMRHRMELMGGTLEIKEASHFENVGALIACKMPLNEEE